MARLPQPGGDRNAWGIIQNEYLSVSHNPDGTIKPAGVQTAVATEVETALSVQLPPAVVDAVAADSTVTAAAAAAIDAEPRVSQLVTDVAEANTTAANAELYATVADNIVYNVMSPAKGPVAAGDGVTDDWGAIQHRLDNLPIAPSGGRGGKVILQPGREYAISQTLEITLPNTDLDGIVGGTITTLGATTIKAMPGFTGPLLRVNIGSGAKGAWIRNLRLDGNGEAGVTAGVEYATGTISVANMFDVAIANVNIGINIKYYAQSLIFERVLAFHNVGTGVYIEGKAYQIIFRECRISGTNWAAIVGSDNNVSADHSEMVMFDHCELYARGSANGVVLLRNVENPRITDCYVESESTMTAVCTALIQVGTASTGDVRTPVITGNRFGGNAKAQYGVNIVKAFAPFVAYNGGENLTSGQIILETAVNTGGFLMGAGLGWNARMVSTIQSQPPAGYDSFTAYPPGSTTPSVGIRASNASMYFAASGGSYDTQITRYGPNIAAMGTGDSFRLDGTWNGGHLWLGNYRLWVDATGALRIKNGAPSSDTDGTVVGTQT